MSSLPANPCDDCIKLTELDHQYRALISKISHEIRNPLTLIYSSVQLLEKEIPAVATSTLWPQLRKDIQDTILLLKDISMLSRNSCSQKKTFSVLNLLEEISASFQSLSRKQTISFISDLDVSLGDKLLSGDKIKLKEALLNLLLNAADALASCKYPGKIILTASVLNHQLVIHIRDNGPGIPEEYLPTLFDPFVTYKKGGTGLGLNIAHHAATQHGGTLTVETSVTGESYTDFCLTIPCDIVS